MPNQVNQTLRKMKKKESTSYFVTNKANKSVVSSAVRMLFSLFSFCNDLSLADGHPKFSPSNNRFYWPGYLPLEKAKASTATTKISAYSTQFMHHIRTLDFEKKMY